MADAPPNDDRFKEINRLFDEALRLSAAERPQFLADACAGDDALRDEILALLRADASASPSFLGSVQSDTADPGSSDMVGQTIGRYTIGKRLGSGGMGVVYEAQQASPNRTVALKLIREDSLSAAHRRRFEYEAELLGRLQHPGIAQIYEAGTDETGRAFIAMELIDGVRLPDGPPDASGVETTLRRMISICDAMHHAHQHGVIHRDLKPGNILVDRAGNPKILDFGVARDLTAALGGATQHTRTGQLIGTLDYMSPEQAAGDPHAIDIRADVYALGVILFRQLTGQLPHTLRDTSILDAVATIRDQPATRLGAVRQHLKGDLETIVAKALEKDKSQRYGSAVELGADLRRFMADEPILARPPSATYQLRTFARRNKVAVGAAIAVVAALASATAISARYALVAQRAETLALERAEAAEDAQRIAEDAQQAEAAQRAIADERVADVRRLANTFLFEIHDQIATLPGAMRARRYLVDTATSYLDILNADQADDPVLRRELANGYMRIGIIQGLPNSSSLGQTAEALVSLTKSRDLYETSAAQNPDPRTMLGVAATERLIAEIHLATGQTDAALEHFQASLGWSERTNERHPGDLFVVADVARAHASIGSFWLARSKPERALSAFIQSEATHADATAIAQSMRNQGFIHRMIRERTITLNDLGRVHGMLGDPEQQAANYDEALELREQILATSPASARARRDVLVSLSLVGNVSMMRGDYGTARDRYDRALGIAQAHAAADPEDARARYDLSVLLEKSGNANLAMRHAQEALDRFEAANDERRELVRIDPSNTEWALGLATSLERCADALAALERTDDARSRWEEAIRVGDALLDRTVEDAGTHIMLIVANHRLAEHLLRQGDVLDACQHAKRAAHLDDRMERLELVRHPDPSRDEINGVLAEACDTAQPPGTGD